MASKVKLGMLWRHDGVQCDGCKASPIYGYRYKSNSRDDHNFCESCYRGLEESAKSKFSPCERCAGSPPFQIWYIKCDGCGQAPVKGPRYKHVDGQLYKDLCSKCSQRCPRRMAGTTNISRARLWNRHFWAKANWFTTSIAPAAVVTNFIYVAFASSLRDCCSNGSECSLCAACFLEANPGLESSRLAAGAIFQPDDAEVVHIKVLGCNHCGAFPICGPAYFIPLFQERYVYCAKCFVLKAKTEDVSAYKKFFPPSAPNLLSSGPNCSDKLTVGQGRVISGNEAVSRNFGKPLPANLQRLGIDLTKIAAEDKMDPVVGRDQQTDQVIQILGRRSKSNACLVGEAGVGKITVVEGLAQRIVMGQVPNVLKGKQKLGQR